MRCLLWTCLLLLAAVAAPALEVTDVRWGFDGQAVPGRFNVLSVLVANSSARAFDGTMKFYKVRGVSDRAGAFYATPCYLSPLTTRWLQFYVYIDNQYDQWQLEWGRAPDDHFEVPAPKWGYPAQVLLSDTESTVSAFKQFPEELFPPTVSATSGLRSVLLDHAPHWEPAKRQAFLDWLRAGGNVHVLMAPDGRYPVFADELAVLNSPLDQQHIGAGLVTRHAATARDIQTKDLHDGGAPQQEMKPENVPSSARMADEFLRVLSNLSQRRYNWEALYALTLLYVVLIGPGNLVAGRKLPDYRVRILLLLGTVAAFAWLFNLVGRRGQGEVGVVHSLSYARAINQDTYDVMQWVNVFSVHGAQYTVTHDSPHNLYASGLDYEAVNGWIESGKGGRFLVDIPMFSRRAFLHEAEMKGVNIPVDVRTWNASGPLDVKVSVGGDFAKQLVAGWLVLGDQVYNARITNDSLAFGNAGFETLQGFVNQHPSPQYSQYNGYGQPPNTRGQDVDIAGEFRNLAEPLLVWSLRADDPVQHGGVSATRGRAQLFLFAHSPDGFRITGSDLGKETGYTLYHFNLFKPGAAE